MSGLETVSEQLPRLVCTMAVVGFAASAYVILVTMGFCSLFHMFVKIIGGKEV